MNNATFILLILILNFSHEKADVKKCGSEIIDNCKECGKKEKSDSCALCEAEHFPLLENLFCIPCNDQIYGQIGCQGECDSSDYSNSGFAYCKECKEGYYNLEGLCFRCETGSPGCKKCTYISEENSENKRFKCQKCVNEVEYIINEDFRCEKCNEKIKYCQRCHFEKKGEDNLPQCDECIKGFYLNYNKTCSLCYYRDIVGGECKICSLDGKPDQCWCYLGYALKGNSCIQCPSHCERCEYNQETNSFKCLRCQKGYTLNIENKCQKCEKGCSFCYLDNNNTSICLMCESNKFLLGGGKCLICPENCLECEFDNDKNDLVCIKCNTSYVLDPKSNQCKYCKNIKETGDGCGTCQYNPLSEKYECLTCWTYHSIGYTHHDYAYVKNTYQCLSNTNPEKIGLYGCLKAEYIQSSDTYECLEAEKIGSNYSCAKCNSDYTKVLNISTNINKCYERENNLEYCLEAKLIENGNFICTKCVENAVLKENVCSCSPNSFSEDTKFCYKCNDPNKGNPGCEETEGCEYFSANDQLNCNKCKNGYFEYTKGQCFLCSNEILNCEKCHYNKTNEKLICDSCINGIYIVNSEINQCQLNDCEEYPEISPGCIICRDKLNEYMENKKCQRCKYGYFKTKDEKCIYCRSEKYGGPDCFECGYETDANGIETDNIICKECYPNYSYYDDPLKDLYYGDYYDYMPEYIYNFIYFIHSILNSNYLSSKGKCYDCQTQFTSCLLCKFIKNSNGIENFKCVECAIGYYLTPEGNCVNFSSYVAKVPNCKEYNYLLMNMNLNFHDENYFTLNYYDNYSVSFYNTYFSEYFLSSQKELSFNCTLCKNGYFLNEDRNCILLDYNICSFNSIMKNYTRLFKTCNDFCDKNDKVLLRLKLKGNPKNEGIEFYIKNFSYNIYNDFIDNFGESNKIKSCLSNSGEGDEYAPENLKFCKEAYFYPGNNTYLCIRCINQYTLYNGTCICQKIIDNSCNVGNIGTEIIPIYDCIELNKRGHNYIIITNENGDKQYIESKGELIGCVEAVENTTYINSKYNCTKCSFMYIPYFNKYFDRIICQNIKGPIMKEHNISFELFDVTKEKVNTTNGTCEKNYLFTPDGDFCYKCDNNLVGMPGCKGECNFSLKRNNPLKCEGGCKTGYIESSEGICSPCGAISKGCHECHYDNDYPSEYKGIKRLRRFVCDYCEEGYIQSPSGECLDCNDLGLDHCTKCEVDIKDSNNYICIQCLENYFANEEGHCETCNAEHFKGNTKNKCIECGNILEGGIDNCLYCETDEEKAVCNECLPGYILLANNNSCLEIVRNKDLHNFTNCEKLIMENNILMCSKCKKEYTLVKRNNIKECIYIPYLYDRKLEYNFENHYYSINKGEISYRDLQIYKNNDYIYNKNKVNYPCQEADNLGTEENPFYSCIKCYEFKGNKGNNYRNPVKITEANSNISFCIDSKNLEELKNCNEATHKIKNFKDEYSCTLCNKNYILTLNKYTDTYYCQISNVTTKCLVLYCKKCNSYNGYICDECLPDYIVDGLTGYCVKKTQVVPAVTWKDIYRLEMNSQKVINNKFIYGPSLIMRGITSNQINTRHSFLIYLTFKIKHRTRNLQEETIIMPAICEVLEGVDETSDDVNMVEYKCIGNQTNEVDLSNYKLDDIEEGNNKNSLKKTNLNELVSEIKSGLGNLDELENIKESSFNLEDIMKIIIFQMNEKIELIKSNNFKFNFKIEGKLNKGISQKEFTLKREFELAEVDNKANCSFRIGLNQFADLTCDLNVEYYKDIKTFSFKTSQINTDDYEIYLSKFNDIILINIGEDEYINDNDHNNEYSDNEADNKNDNNDNKSKRKIKIIIVSIICGLISFVLIGVGIFYLVKKLKLDNNFNNAEENNNKNMKPEINISDNIPASGERIINFKN